MLRASNALDDLDVSGEEKVGVNILRRALEAPCRQIVNNAGQDGAIVVQKIKESGDPNYGFNAASLEYVDLIQAGIIDPAKVTRCALQNAASVSSLLLTTDALVSEVPKKEKEKVGAAGMGDGYDDMDY